MRTKLTAVLVTMLTSGLASASCEMPSDHVELRECLERKVDQLSQEVNAAQQIVRDKIAAWDEEPYYKSRSLELFDQATSQFKVYQASQCQFEASAAAGGNGAGDMRLSCQIDLYKVYLKSLNEQATWFDPPHA
jgi:hypothetical protein